MVRNQYTDSILALIHHHLLQYGYTKTARELQIESGEKFTPPKVTLRTIIIYWNREAKKRKDHRVLDSDSAPESSDDEDKALQKEAADCKGTKKSSEKKTAKVKPVSATSKKMNSTKESEVKVKSTPKITSPPLNDKSAALDAKAAAELAESSDSDSENKPQIQASTLKPTPGAEETSASSSTSESEEEETAKQVTTKTVSARSTPAKTPTAKKATSNGKAVVTNDVSESSDDETDIDKPVVALTPRPAGPSSIQTAKLKAQTPPTAPQPEAESSSGSSESESEEESKMPTPVIAASQVKIDTPLTKAITTSQTDSSLGKTQSLTKAGASENSDDSDSEEEPEHQKVAALVHATPKKGVSPKKVATPASWAKASKPETTAADPKPPESGESGSSDSDSHTEEVSQKIPTPRRTSTLKKQPATPLRSTPVAVGKAKTPLQATQPADDSSETESSDNDNEPLAKKIATPHLATGKKQPMMTPLSTPAGKSKTPLQAPPPADDGSETDLSDSDDELLVKKIATPHLVSTGKKQPVTPSLSTPAGKPKTPLQAPKSEEDSSETESSDSDDKKPVTGSSSVPVRNSVPSTPSTAVKQSAPDSDADSESSDSSDSEEKTPVVTTPKPATPAVAAMGKLQTSTASQPGKESSSDDSESDSDEPVKTVPKATVGKTVPVKAVAAPILHPEDGSETNGSDEEEEPKPVVATPKPATPALIAKGKPQISAVPQPDEQSSSDDSESDSNVKSVLNASLKVAPPALKSAMRPNSAAKVGSPAKAFTNTKAAAAAKRSDSSDSSDVEEEQTESRKLPTKQKLDSPTPSNTNVAKGKSSQLTKTPPVEKLAPADASESSDTDSDEEETTQVLTPTPSTVKTKDGKVTGKLAKTPTPSSTKKVKATSTIKTPVTVRQESTESVSDSSVKPAVKRGKKEAAPAAVTSTRKASKSVKTPESSVLAAPKTKVMSPIKTPVVSKQAAAESSSDSSDSEEDSKAMMLQGANLDGTNGVKVWSVQPKPATPKPAAPASVGKSKKAAPPPVSKESNSDDSDSDSEEEPVKSNAEASASMAAKQGKPATPTKMKVPSSAKTPVLAKPPAEETSSATSSDSEDEVPVQTPTLLLKIKSPVKKDSGKVEKKATGAVGDKSSHELPLFEEQPPAKPSIKKRKRDSQVEEQSVSDTEKVGKAKKKKSEGKVKPDAAPTPAPPAAPEPVPPALSGAMLDSEEETVLALLEGRNPKKAKRIKSSKKDIVASGANTLAAIPEQDNNVPAGPNPSVWVPDSPSSGDEADVNLNVISPSAQEIAQSPAKNVKSGKKRKISPEDGHSKLKAKSAKKKEKKLKSGLEGEIVASKKDKQKSEKKKPKKKKNSKNKEDKKSKKLKHSITAPVAESTDSGIGLLSKPKKKKKTEGLG
ncbi:treacle protein isoform X2 [Mixophyes fleayi]|uniref:treacle protein isoform X2 n=1 Tax=Mixophyes fleayi TaxID=3061075 RepID=UPI003F4DB862